MLARIRHAGIGLMFRSQGRLVQPDLWDGSHPLAISAPRVEVTLIWSESGMEATFTSCWGVAWNLSCTVRSNVKLQYWQLTASLPGGY